MPSLFNCYQSQLSRAYCIEKTVETITSLSIFTLASIQFGQLLYYDSWMIWPPKMKYVIYIMMLLSLLFNVLHSIMFDERYFFLFETFWFNVYFLTIVFYFTHRLFLSMYPRSKKPLLWLRIGYAIFVGIFVMALFVSIFVKDVRCQQIWYVTVRSINVVLAFIFVVMGSKHEKKEADKIATYEGAKVVNNPLPRLRFWILLNVISQGISCIQSIIFVSDPALKCQFDLNNEQVNWLVAYLLLIITYYFSVASTIAVFYTPCCQKKQPQLREREITIMNHLNHMHLELVQKPDKVDNLLST